MLTDIMPLEEWEKCYSKYSANELYMSPAAVANQVGEKVSALGTGKIVKEYLRTFFHCPYKIIEDRLYGIDIMWNIVQDTGSAKHINPRYGTHRFTKYTYLKSCHAIAIQSDRIFSKTGR